MEYFFGDNFFKKIILTLLVFHIQLFCFQALSQNVIQNFLMENRSFLESKNLYKCFKYLADYSDSLIKYKLKNDTNGFIIQIVMYNYNENNPRIQYFMKHEKDFLLEYYNTYPHCDGSEWNLKWIPNECANYDLKAVDTINKHIIITKPIRKKYKIWVPMCSRSFSKKKSIQFFKEKIYSQYQLQIFKINDLFVFYFILPPDKKYPLRHKIIWTHF